ncbi:hypothetical protein B0J14DRAFT_655281 [Halenospora varia]|nr:hypothetical protein B0J14DRAFT_655281 [Halenospora varia]
MAGKLSSDTIQTLILLWVFTWGAMFLMAVRLIMRKVRGQRFDLGDKLTFFAMFCLMARLGFIHVVLIWGSNNVSAAFRANHKFTSWEIYQREMGSKLTITSRPFYNTYLWVQKSVVLALYQRILSDVYHTKIIIKAYWAILAVTYVVIQVAVFTDCRPIHLYWQVVPDPGTCSQALGELVILGGLNIFTDILLIILPLPTLLKVNKSLGSKLRLVSLFSLGIFLVIITVIRLPFNIKKGGMQINRTTWASVEAFVAAFVANIPTLYTLRRALPGRTNELERGNGRKMEGWTEDGKSSRDGSSTVGRSPTPTKSQTSAPYQKHKLAQKSVEIQERRKAMFIPPIPPKDNVVSGGWDRKARIKDSKVEYTGGQMWDEEKEDLKVEPLQIRKARIVAGKVEYTEGGEWDVKSERLSVDSLIMFSPKI